MNGNQRAAEKLLPLVYDELRKLAVAKPAHEAPGRTLQATDHNLLLKNLSQPTWVFAQ